ncbi:hypothetical protein [Methanococcus sp. CF]
MDIESQIKRYFKKDISYMLFIVIAVMFSILTSLTVFHVLGFKSQFLIELFHDLTILLGFFIVVSIIGIVVLEFIF